MPARSFLLGRCFRALLLCLLSCSLLTGCHAEQEAASKEESQEAAVSDAAPASTPAAATTAFPGAAEVKRIRHATLRFQVADLHQSLTRIQQALKAQGAYLAASQDFRQDDHLETTLTIRVPAPKLDLLLQHLLRESIYLDYKNISSEDVGLEFVDLSARLKAKKAVEARFLDLLQQASSIKDILQIETELKVIREEIESIQARLNYLNSQVAYSTITLTVYESAAGRAAGNKIGVRMVNALAEGWNLFLTLLLGLLHIWPLLLLAPLLVYAWRRFRRHPPGVK